MPVSGLVVSLTEESRARADALAAIRREPRIATGVFAANRLAIVLDTSSSEEDRQVWDWLNTLAGVSLVEVAFVGFEQAEETGAVRAGKIPPATRGISAAGRKHDSADGH